MNRRAFTLIEVLVVIAIIAILAAVLFPVFSAAKRRAKETVSSNNVRQIGMGIFLYSADYDTQLPWAVDPGAARAFLEGGHTTECHRLNTWQTLDVPLASYVKNNDIYRLPLDQSPMQPAPPPMTGVHHSCAYNCLMPWARATPENLANPSSAVILMEFSVSSPDPEPLVSCFFADGSVRRDRRGRCIQQMTIPEIGISL